MRSPEGQEFPNVGCYLEVIKNEKLVWTTALAPGYRPSSRPSVEVAECGLIVFTAVISFEPHGNGTKYIALAIHGEEEDRKKHEEMGFYDGGGKLSISLLPSSRKCKWVELSNHRQLRRSA